MLPMRRLSIFALISASLSLAAPLAAPLAAFANPRIVVDVASGRVIDHEEAFRRWYPASLTKLMTAYVTFKALERGEVTLETPIVMSKKSAGQPASKMYFKPGQRLTLDSALKILLVKSANDIAYAIAENIAGSHDDFVARMNAEAARLGMSRSHFINPNGLPGKGQYTTARDLAVLAVALKREFPQYAGYFALEGIDTGKKKYPNYNLLIGRFDGADGMKTGFICASGFNQVSSATRNGRSVVSVVLGTESLGARADLSADLMQAALGKAAGTRDTLQTLAPYGDNGQVADLSKEICSAKGAKVRSEGRDEAGRMKLISPNVHELTREPNYVFAGLLPDPAKSANTGGKQALADAEDDLATVPVPLPRPSL